MIKIVESSTFKIGYRVNLLFKLSQHSRNDNLMQYLIEYLDCGNIYKHQDEISFQVVKFSDLTQKIIPFFKKYPFEGVKLLDFLDFVKVAELMENKAHLTEEGLNEIRAIKAGMNRNRK